MNIKKTRILFIIMSLLKASIRQQILRYKMNKAFLKLKKNIKINQDLISSQSKTFEHHISLLNNIEVLKRSYVFLKDELGYQDVEVEKILKI